MEIWGRRYVTGDNVEWKVKKRLLIPVARHKEILRCHCISDTLARFEYWCLNRGHNILVSTRILELQLYKQSRGSRGRGCTLFCCSSCLPKIPFATFRLTFLAGEYVWYFASDRCIDLTLVVAFPLTRAGWDQRMQAWSEAAGTRLEGRRVRIREWKRRMTDVI